VIEQRPFLPTIRRSLNDGFGYTLRFGPRFLAFSEDAAPAARLPHAGALFSSPHDLFTERLVVDFVHVYGDVWGKSEKKRLLSPRGQIFPRGSAKNKKSHPGCLELPPGLVFPPEK